MNASRWLERALEPSLVRRSVWAVLLAFFLVWAALLSYLYLDRVRIRTQDPGLPKFAAAMEAALAHVHSEAEGAAFAAATATWMNIRRQGNERVPGALEFELLDTASGRRVYATPGLWADALPAPAAPVQALELQGTHYLLTQARTPQWTLRIAEPLRSDAAFLSYNARFLLPYLLIALPIVLLAIWLPILRGLRPLQELATRIGARDASDLRPVGFDAKHRELKPLVAALDDLLARLRHKLERERAFVQDAAHEIRTPLAVINAQAHVLAHADNAAERVQAETQLDQAIARTSHMAQQLLDLAALDQDGAAHTRHLDVAHWLRGALAPLAQSAFAKDMELSLEAPEQLAWKVEVAALGSVVNNLVDNALRYGRQGGTVAVALHEAGGELHVRVQDDGPGIAQALHAKIFERFYRGADHEARGSGLGLAIVRQAALRMGGGVEIGEGLDGRGVGFVVRIPSSV
ncbi:sensor histidine kinase [Variovorax sp. LARHSF232]